VHFQERYRPILVLTAIQLEWCINGRIFMETLLRLCSVLANLTGVQSNFSGILTD
jgi:hypothetical protein